MPCRVAIALSSIVGWGLLGVLWAAGAVPPLSRDQAETFAKKVALIVQHSSTAAPEGASRRTTLTEGEMNSWFSFRGQRVLPTGVTSPSISLVGAGRVTAGATVDLEEVGRRRGTGGAFDVWSYLSGRVPITVTGILHTKEGRGRFEVQEAAAGGVPVPKLLLQELVSIYTRTPEDTAGMQLDSAFDLPLGIRQVELGQGQATVVQ